MADVKRTVDVNIKVTGTEPKKLTDLAANFTAIGDAIKAAVGAIDELKSKLESFKTPDNLTAVVTNLKELGKIKVPNITQIAEGFERLSKIKEPPDLTKFATEVAKFDKISVPNIKQLAQGLEKLSSSSVNMGDAGAKLRILQRNLKRFSDINVPNISAIAKGLIELNKVSAINIQTKSLDALVNAVTKLNGLKVPNLNKLVESLKGLGGIDLSKAERSISRLADVIKQFSDKNKLPAVTGLVNGLNKLIALDVGAVTKKIRELNGALKLLKEQGFLNEFAKFASDLNKVSAGLGKTKKAVDQYTASTKKAGKETRTFGERVKNYLQYRFIADLVFKMKEAAMAAWEAIKSYDQALKDLQAITGATSLEVEQMGDTIKKVASTTKFSAAEVAEGMRTIGQAGFTAAEAIQTMQAVSNLATGTLSDMSTTVDLVTTAMRVFKINASESTMVSDVFANAVNRSKLTIDKLRTSFNYVGPIAREAGVSFKDMSASMMTLANSGLRASTIGTGLRRVFAELVDPSKKLRAAVSEAGLAMSDIDLQTKGLSEVIGNLGIVIDDAQTAFDIFGKRGAAAALALSDSEGQFSQMRDTVGRSGIAAQQAAKQMEGLGVSFKNLQDKLGLLAIAIGDLGITDALRILIDVSRALIDVFVLLIDNVFAKFIGKSIVLIGSIWAINAAFTFLLGLRVPAFFTTIGTAVATATTALITFEVSLSVITVALATIASVVFAIIIPLTAAFALLGQAGKASDEAAKLADEYKTLEGRITSFKENTSKLKEGSDELKEANIDLRKELIKTSFGMSEVADEAARAAAQIDPLTGKILKGGEALREYNDAVQEVKLEKLVEAANKAFDNIETRSSAPQKLASAFGQVWDTAKDALSGGFQGFAYLLNGQGEEAGKAFIDGFRNFSEAGTDRIGIANWISDQVAEGKLSFDDLQDYVNGILNSFDASDLMEQEREIIEAFQKGQERVESLFASLLQSEQITLESTVEGVRKLAEQLGLSAYQADAIISKLTTLQKNVADTPTSFIEKWMKDLDERSGSLDSFIQKYRELGGTISAEQEKSLHKNEQLLYSFGEQLNLLEARYKAEIQGGADVYATTIEFEAKKTALMEKVAKVRTDIANDEKAAGIAGLREADKVYAASLKTNTDLHGRSKAAAIENIKAQAQHQKDLNRAVTTVVDPKKLVADTKVAAKEIKDKYVAMYKEIELEKLSGTVESRKISNQKLRFLEMQEAEETKNIWIDVYNKIEAATGADSPQARAAKKASLDAQIAQGNLTVKQAKKIAEEEKKVREEAYETANSKRESAYQIHTAIINEEVATGVKTHEEGELAKLKASQQFYVDALVAARNYKSSIDKERDPDGYQKALQDEIKAEEDLYKARSKALEDYNKQAKSLSEDLVKDQRKFRSEEEKHSDKLLDLKVQNADKMVDVEDDYADTIRDINYALQDKLKDLEQKRFDTVKKFADKRKDVEDDYSASITESADDIQDALDKINQRGMKDKEKEKDNARIATRELGELENRLRVARREGNKEEIDSILDRTDKVKDLYAGLENTSKARSGLRRLKEFKEDVFEAGKDISLATLAEEEQRELAKQKKELDHVKVLHDRKMTDLNEEHTEKINEQADSYNDAITKEDSRHDKALANIRIEAKTKLDAAIEVAKALEALTSGQTPSSSASPSSVSSTSSATGTSADSSLQQVKKTGNEVSTVLQKAIAYARSVGVELEKGLGDPLVQTTEDAKKGFEELILVTNEQGKQMVTTANSMAQGYSNFGKIVKTESLAAIQKLKKETQALADQTPEGVVRLKTDESVGKVKSILQGIKKEILSIGTDASGISIIGPKELAEIDKATDKLNFLFEGLDTEDPKQKLQDMITTFRAMGNASIESKLKMAEAIKNYANSLEGVDLKDVQVKTETGFKSIVTIVDETGKKIEGLSSKIQSNPFDLFPPEVAQDIIKNIESVAGVMDNLKKNIQERIKININKEQAEQEVADIMNSLDDMRGEVNDDPIGAVIEAHMDQESKDRAIDDLQEITGDPIGVIIQTSIDNEGIDATMAAFDVIIAQLEARDAKLSLQIDADVDAAEEEFEELQQKVADEELNIEIDSSITNPEEVKDLIAWVNDDDDAYKKVNIDVTIPNEEKVTTLKTRLDELIEKPLVILLDISEALKSLRELTNELFDLVKKYDGKTIKVNVETKYTSTGSPPATGKFHGGYIDGIVQQFANGGNVFKKLVDPFINTGSGTKDDVPAMLTKGEFVLNPRAVLKYGRDFIASLNNLSFGFPKLFASGGMVDSAMSSGISTPSSSGATQMLKFVFDDVSTDAFQVKSTDAEIILNQFKKMGRLSSV